MVTVLGATMAGGMGAKYVGTSVGDCIAISVVVPESGQYCGGEDGGYSKRVWPLLLLPETCSVPVLGV